jgi:S-adenosyl methyltransferase
MCNGTDPDEQPGDDPVEAVLAHASIARVYDYWLGGKDNYAVDREAGDRLLAIYPDAARLAQDNRAFLERAVRYVAGHGIRQFLDVGSGLPTSPNVHEIARSVIRDARVVYLDKDPIVLAHLRALLTDTAGLVGVAAGDMRDPQPILTHPEVCRLIDFTEPACVLLVSVLHFVPAKQARFIVKAFSERMAAGSYLIISAGTSSDPGLARRFTSAYSPGSLISHPAQEISRWFCGLELVAPGLVNAAGWRPQGTPQPAEDHAPVTILAGVARKPGQP